jgi:hypothetical protein
MFVRLLLVLVVSGVAALAAGPAWATDDPTPKKPPAAPTPKQTPQTPVTPQACLDTFRPTARLNATWARGFKRGVINGSATDRGCGASGAGKLTQVRVSVARRVGSKCQHVLSNGRLGRATNCAPRWLVAKGTASWSLKLRRKLPTGKYVVRVSAVDSAGNVQLHRA